MLNDKFVKINSYGLDEVIEENEESTTSEVVIQPLDVIPSTSAQRIEAPEGIDGYNPINVSGVTSSIDSNIIPENIKEGVNILGVVGDFAGGSGHDLPREVVNGKLVRSTDIIDLTGITDLGDYALYCAYYNLSLPQNTQIDFSSLTTISGNYSCYNAFAVYGNITSADLGNITTISGDYACYGMFASSGCRSKDLSSLTTISGGWACEDMFGLCWNMTTLGLDSLTTISGTCACQGMFKGTGITNANLDSVVSITGDAACNAMFERTFVTSASFANLNVITYPICNESRSMFGQCFFLENVYFGGLTASTFAERTDQLQYLFDDQTGIQTPDGVLYIHFPSNFDPDDPNHTFDAQNLDGYPEFGAYGVSVEPVFDLDQTE